MTMIELMESMEPMESETPTKRGPVRHMMSSSQSEEDNDSSMDLRVKMRTRRKSAPGGRLNDDTNPRSRKYKSRSQQTLPTKGSLPCLFKQPQPGPRYHFKPRFQINRVPKQNEPQILKLMQEDVDPYHANATCGCIYMMKSPHHNGFIKIGVTTRNLDKRRLEVGRNHAKYANHQEIRADRRASPSEEGFDYITPINGYVMTPHSGRLEKLIHHELSKYEHVWTAIGKVEHNGQFSDIFDSGTRRSADSQMVGHVSELAAAEQITHETIEPVDDKAKHGRISSPPGKSPQGDKGLREWFLISEHDARQVFDHWNKWIASRPYAPNGQLNSFWRNKAISRLQAYNKADVEPKDPIWSFSPGICHLQGHGLPLMKERLPKARCTRVPKTAMIIAAGPIG
ncbi:MAG: hypothetical protein M1814_002095 [Vezdaea aestivalis]|nr:MAG: hypothetical protein M1814_002095 [Vezdaea aestivalis]